MKDNHSSTVSVSVLPLSNNAFTLNSDQLTFIARCMPQFYSLKPINILPSSQNDSHPSQLTNTTRKRTQDSSSYSKQTKRRGRKPSAKSPAKGKKNKSPAKKKKNLKNSIEMKFLTRLKKSEYSEPFLVPVDTEQEGIADYYEVIDEPMDISTVQTKLFDEQYNSFQEFNNDLKKIWENSYTFNKKNSKIYKWTLKMDELHQELLAEISGKSSREKQSKAQRKVSKKKNNNNISFSHQTSADSQTL